MTYFYTSCWRHICNTLPNSNNEVILNIMWDIPIHFPWIIWMDYFIHSIINIKSKPLIDIWFWSIKNVNTAKAWIIQSLLWFQHSLPNSINVTTLPRPGIPDNTCKFPISFFFFCQCWTTFSTVMKKRRKCKSILGLCWGYILGEIF